MLEEHKIHRSLLRPPLLFGVERSLFFTSAALAVPIIGYGRIGLRSLAVLVIYLVLAYFVCTRLTAKDHDLLSLFRASLRYRDHYAPLPEPGTPARRPGRRS
ncbi:MAG TPA: VirB3 family type IV secretion system protein [Thermoanaerobaculia bacterium]|nr:VirB3 family type IV secretion system protein [Thermoanaerobaculia bacterium]